MIIPMSSLSLVLSIFMKPKRADPKYFRTLNIHFISFCVIAEIASFVAFLRLGDIFGNAFALVRMLLWVLCFRLLLKFRKVVSQLPADEVSHGVEKGENFVLFLTMQLLLRIFCCSYQISSARLS